MAKVDGAYGLAMAAARDAGNRRMREAGRRAWTVGDLRHATAEFDRIYEALQGQSYEAWNDQQNRENNASLDAQEAEREERACEPYPIGVDTDGMGVWRDPRTGDEYNSGEPLTENERRRLALPPYERSRYRFGQDDESALRGDRRRPL